MKQRLIDAAREWFDAGYCVIPAHPDGSKRPFSSWKVYQSNRMPWDDLEKHLASGRYTGIGVITGAVSGNLELIEIEGPCSRSEQAVKAVTKAAFSETWKHEIGPLWHTLTQGCGSKSAGGGRHFFIRVSDGAVSGNQKLATDSSGKVIAETRGEGGFVIVAPSPGRKSHEPGSTYEFHRNQRPANTPSVNLDDLEALHFLVTFALDEANEVSQAQASMQVENEGGYVPVAIESNTETDLATPWGDFAKRTTWAEILEPHGWYQGHLASDGRTHWTRPGKNHADGASATTLEDGPMYVFSTNAGLPANEGMSKAYVHASLSYGGDLREATRALVAAGYGTPAGTLNPLVLAGGDGDAGTFEGARRRLPIINWHDLWTDQTEEEWIAQPLIPARRLVALYSAPKVGKSLLMLELAARVAAGLPIFGYPAQQPRKCLYVDFENDPRGDVRSRLQAMNFTPDDLGNLYYVTFPLLGALDSELGGRELLAAAQDYQCELIVIDTISRAVTGEESSNDTWLGFYRHTGLKLKQAGISLVRLDHSGKDQSKGQRGGSAKSGDVDAVWRLKTTTDTRLTLECEAARFPIAEKSLVLRREEDPLRHVATNDTYRDKVAELHRDMDRKSVPKDASMTVRQMRDAMRDVGLSFDQNLVSSSFIQKYAALPSQFHAAALDFVPGQGLAS